VRVGQPATLSDPEIDNEDDVITLEDIEDLTPDKVIVTVTPMHYGMKDKSPLEFVKFYPKNRPDGMSYCTLNSRTPLQSVFRVLSCATRRSVFAHAGTLRGDPSARLHKRSPVRTFSSPPPGSITEKRPRFFGIVQAGYRSLLARVVKAPEPTSIDVLGSESDGIPERPCTPRTFSRVSSFNKSFSAGPGDSGENGSPYLNQFTTVSRSYGKSLSPTKIPAPRPLYAPAADLGLEKGQMDDDEIVAHPPLLLVAPTSPTRAKHELNTLFAASTRDNNSPDDITGEVDSASRGGNDTSTGTALVAGNASPARGMRSSKRLREGRGGDAKREHPEAEGGTTPNKRKKL
jgi:hypothetical protein